MYTIILAGGLGKRMNSDIPKVLHKVDDIPMICHVIKQAFKVNSNEILIVVGRYKNIIESTINEFFSKKENQSIKYILQEDQTVDGKIKTMGTGDAIRCCIPYLQKIRNTGSEQVIILSGDVPLIQHKTIEMLLTSKNALLTSFLQEPFGCGRIFMNEYGGITNIVEEKDCNDEEIKCKQVNCGIYNLNIDTIIKCVPLIDNNNKSEEYYLTDIVEIANNHNISIHSVLLPLQNSSEILNVNTPNDLKIANSTT
jgi:bifunctional N-acetylglucosamine-1-phosphate-uridyltransferase/glucosamine-1-phosphate-acetyltransferase GlmU-like protein